MAHFGPVSGPGVSGLTGAAFAVGICDDGSSLIGAFGPVDGVLPVVALAGDVAGLDAALDLPDEVVGAVTALGDPEVFPGAPTGDRPDSVAELPGVGEVGCAGPGPPVTPELVVTGAATFVVTVTTPASLPLPQPVSTAAAAAASATPRRVPETLDRNLPAARPSDR